MASSNKIIKSNTNIATPLVLSLPCFKPILLDAILNQSQTTLTNISPAFSNQLTKDDEKENKSQNFWTSKELITAKKSKNESVDKSKNQEYLNNEMSSSENVPIARLVGIEKQQANQSSIHNEKDQMVNTKFVFSPIGGRKSFLSQQNSSSASKAELRNNYLGSG